LSANRPCNRRARRASTGKHSAGSFISGGQSGRLDLGLWLRLLDLSGCKQSAGLISFRVVNLDGWI
jgi:hypothetical protein